MKSIAPLFAVVAVSVACVTFGTASAQETERGRERATHQSPGAEPRQPAGAGAQTTGEGPSVPSNGPFYDPSIHQSAGDRDSRGFPKYCPNKDC